MISCTVTISAATTRSATRRPVVRRRSAAAAGVMMAPSALNSSPRPRRTPPPRDCPAIERWSGTGGPDQFREPATPAGPDPLHDQAGVAGTFGQPGERNLGPRKPLTDATCWVFQTDEAAAFPGARRMDFGVHGAAFLE